MRIRRRPPGQPLAYLLPSDPPAPRPPPAAPGDRQERAVGDDRKEEPAGLHLHPDAAADLGVGDGRSSPVKPPALLPLLAKDSVVERGRGLGGAHQQQGPAADGHRSLENGHHHVLEPVIKAGERLSLSNGIAGAAAMVAVATTVGTNATKQQEMKEDRGSNSGGKKPRGPGVLLEGSRCSRKNGRGWRCSQPTMVGYALCQYHLGKGRVRAAAAAAAVRLGVGQLGRTEHGKKASAAPPPPPKAGVPLPPPPPKVDVLPPPKVEVPPPLKAEVPPATSVQNC